MNSASASPVHTPSRPLVPFNLLKALCVTGASAITLFSAGCSAKPEQTAAAPNAAIVQAARPAGVSVTEWSGVVRTRDGATLAASVPGRVRTIHVDVGDRVTAGQLLLELDPEPFQLQLRQAEAEVRAAAPALAEAKRRQESEERLWASGATSLAEYDAAQSGFAAAKARTEAAAANLGLAERALRESRLSAPAHGRIARRFVSTGTFIDAGTPLVEFDSADSTEVVLTVSSARLAGLGAGQAIEIRSNLTATTPTTTTSEITHLGQRSLDGGVHEVLVRLPAGAALFPGEPVLARLPDVAAERAVSVPATAVQRSAEGVAEVLVVNASSGVVQRRPVQVGTPHGAELTLSAGVQAGELVVATGGAFLRDGQTVRPILRD